MHKIIPSIIFFFLCLLSFSQSGQTGGSSDFTLRINTGGTETTYNDEVYLADTYFNTGSVLDRPQTGLPEPFQTFRFSRSQQMGYDIPLEDGEYTVNLYFAELWFGATGGGSGGVGSRVFDVNIEGQLAEDNLDVFAEVGADAMLMKSYNVTVSGGILDIDFDSRDAVGGARHPIINAIEILGVEPLDERPFITTWKTDNPGVSEDNQITIPTYPGETYNYSVDWGDGTIDSAVTEDITHTYSTPGTYEVSITGDFPRIYFYNEEVDRFKILSVKQWGDISWKSFGQAFFACYNMDVTTTDFPDFSNVSRLSGMFSSCESMVGNSSFENWDVSNITAMEYMFSNTPFNQNISNWDVSNVTYMDGMFQKSSFNQDISAWNMSRVSRLPFMFRNSAFNQPIGDWDLGNAGIMNSMFEGAIDFNQGLGNWNVASVTRMEDMFKNSALSLENYDNTLIGWSTQQLRNGVTFDGGNSQYCQGEEARQKLIDDFGWVITDAGKSADCPDTTSFITTWKTDNPGTSEDSQITIPTFPGDTYNYSVNWGDGSSSSGVTGNITHTYATPGTYQVSISGEFPRIYFNKAGDKFKFLQVQKWGDIVWSSMENAFDGCSFLDVIADDAPDLSLVSSTAYMFRDCRLLTGTGQFNGWDTSHINNMTGMFIRVDNFTSSIGNWDVGNVEDMSAMFLQATNFDQDLSAWQVSNVKSMEDMFAHSSFNSDVSAWNVGNVTTMAGMFWNSPFNRNISDWEVSNVTDMSSMFGYASSFNQDLSGWNVGKLEKASSMFFNSGLSNTNYDKLLVGWSQLPSLQNNVIFHAPDVYYCEGKEERQFIIDTYNWDIVDAGVAADCPEPNDFALRINAGGSEVDYNGETFITDTYFNTGNTLDRPQTGLPEPFQTFRFSRSQQMNYDIPLEDGEYTVKLYFAELWFGATGGGSGGVGSRVFDVRIEGELAEDNLDVFAEVGADAMLMKTYTVNVSGGILDIDFNSTDAVGGERHPIINAIEILGEASEPVERPFVTTWKTDNPGASEDNQITIYAFGENNNYNIDWGDGTSNTGVDGNIIHTYPSPGTYQVSITGLFAGMYFNNGGNVRLRDDDKIISIDQWGDMKWTWLGLAFAGCDNLDVKATDVPDFSAGPNVFGMFVDCPALMGNNTINSWDMSQIDNIAYMFNGASQFNQPLHSWDVSKVRLMYNVFQGATSFNQDISNWDVGEVTLMEKMFSGAISFDQNLGGWSIFKVTNMEEMFDGATLSTENYDNTLSAWSTQQLQNGVAFDGGNSQYCQGKEARQKLIDDFGWTITDGGRTADCQDTTSFITTWKTDNPGVSADNQITIPTFEGEVYNYSVDWGDGTSDTGVMGDITHSYETPGTYQVSISGDFPRIISNDRTDRLKLLSINQWGDINWKSMTASFSDCRNLDIVAQDVPNLSEVTDLFSTFSGCSSLVGNESFNNWSVGTITNMTQTFTNCLKFDADISSWDVSNVTNMFNLFDNCPSFNQDISGWDVAAVTDMGFMFSFASNFNQSIGGWNVSNVTNMRGMFQGDENSKFNQDIGDWDVSQVTDMSQMFVESTKFNQNLDKWDVGRVVSMRFMFGAANSFDQDLSSWDISNVTDLTGMFFDIELSTENYDNTLNAWSNQQLQNNVVFDGGSSEYCQGEEARQKLIDDFGWTITDGGKTTDCEDTTSFITTWKTDNPGTSEDNQITIPTYPGETYNYTVDWGDGIITTGETGDATHTYTTSGTYQVSISGDFPRIYFNNSGDKDKLLLVSQWGDVEWTSMQYAFSGCSNLDVVAMDTPNLSNVSELVGMFNYCTSLLGNSNFNDWDVSSITSMIQLFEDASSFNQPLNNWDVSKVGSMFLMFSGAASFDQNLSSWNVSNVYEMTAMFTGASTFNQNLSSWNVGNVDEMSDMFDGAVNFDQDLSGWDISSVTSMADIFNGVTLSTENYDHLLNSWSTQQLQSGVTFNGGNSQYCAGAEARQKLIDDFGWTITDGGRTIDCHDTTSFITTWKTDKPGISEDNQITIPTHPDETYNYSVDWGDGTSNSGVTGDITHTYAQAGSYKVSISGEFPRIYFFNASGQKDNEKLLEINQWGEIAWSSMESAFYECKNMDLLTTDVPDLSNVSDIGFMFNRCTNLVANESIEDWNTSTITNMSGVFLATMFNQNIGNWDTSIVETMDVMFYYAQSFNQDIGNWDVSSLTAMVQMFEGAQSFNQDISNWDVSNVVYMWDTFYGASSFNQNLANWDVSNVEAFVAFLENSGLSDENYNNMLIGWSQLPSLKSNLTLHTAQSQFCEAKEARQFIIDTYGWTINDAGESEECEVILDFALRINTGGAEIEYNGETFITDTYFTSGTTLDRPQTGLPEPFQTFRFSRSQQMGYDIPLEDGEYTVNLYFAELWFGATSGGSGGVGSRIFDVNIEGQLAEDNLDVFAEAGADAMLMKSYTVTVTGGVLNIDFDSRDAVGGERHPIINAIEILGQATEPIERPFVTTWKTDNPGNSQDNQITIPTFPGETYNYSVDWGDGNSVSGVTGSITHTYAVPGTYQVSISGDFPRLYFNDDDGSDDITPDNEKLLFVNQWGDINWSSMGSAFSACFNLDIIAEDTPNLSNVTDMSNMLNNCFSLVGTTAFNNWDVSKVTNMGAALASTLEFNQDISNWDISSVNYTAALFFNAVSFNQDVSDWNTSSVIDMSLMFFNAISFNQDISGWNVSNVASMESMFDRAMVFDQNLGGWNVESVTNMASMFNETELSEANYDSLLQGWSTQLLQNEVIFDAGNSAYCQGEEARQKLVDDYGWIITDAGKAANCIIPTSDEFWLEAECANVGENWSVINSADASGGQYLLPPAGANYNVAPTDPNSVVTFNLDAEAGIYKIYARVSVPSVQDDSFWVRVNGETWLRWNLIPGSSDFSWHQVHDRELNTSFLTFDLLDGVNTIEIGHREDGAGLDKLYVTRIPNVPTGFGGTDETCTSSISGKRAIANAATLSPNPVVTSTILSFEKPVRLNLIQVFDIAGRLVHTYKGTEVADDGAYLLNVNTIPAGTYFIKSQDSQGEQYQKQMVIQR